MHGYLAISIQHDLPTDAPVQEMKKIRPSAEHDRLTVVRHFAGSDISMYYPDHIKEVVTLDNLRVPFMTDGKFKTQSFRSKDPQFKTNTNRLPALRYERSRFRQRQIGDPGHARQIPR